MKIETRLYPFGTVTFKKIGTTGVINFRALYTIRSNKKDNDGKFLYEPQFIDCKIWSPRDISKDMFKVTVKNGKEKYEPLDVIGYMECETYTNKSGEKVVKPVIIIDNYSEVTPF